MRTTLTLDPDVARAIARRLKASGGRGLKTLINSLIRAGLSVEKEESHTEKEQQFRVRPLARRFVPGLDPLRLKDALLDEEERSFKS